MIDSLNRTYVETLVMPFISDENDRAKMVSHIIEHIGADANLDEYNKYLGELIFKGVDAEYYI